MPQGALPSDNYATVFIYHRFGDERYPTTSVSLEDFKKQLEYLKNNGYRVVKLSELYKMAQEKKIPPKTVAITVDDGYRTTYKAFKLLKEFNFPFTLFLYMEAVGRYPDFLTEEQLREMEESGLVEFENHLYSHPRLARLRIKLTEKEYLKVLKREAELSEKRFLKLFGRKPRFLAFPYGDYDRISVEFFKKRGYKLLLTQDRGNWDGKRVLVPRMAVVGSQSSFKRFVADLKVEPLPIKKHEPPIGLYKKPTVRPVFGVEERFKNCWVYLTEIGWVKGVKEGIRVTAQRELPLKKPSTRVGIRCRDGETKRKAEFFYLIIKGAQSPQR